VLSELLTFLRDSEGPEAYIKTLRKLGVIEGLSAEQAAGLSSLVGEFYAQGDSVKWLTPQKRQRREWAREGHARIRKLRAKIKAARFAVNAVRGYLGQLDVPISRTVNDALDSAVAALDPSQLENASRVIALLDPSSTTRPQAMVALYEYFVSVCKLPRDEAQVRTGEIGNYLWDWNVTVIKKPKARSDQRKGCEAVRKAIPRYRRDK
jgi:hypothetical protein